MASHEHSAEDDYDRCFAGPVCADENPASHGNVCRIEVCSCGAERRININGNHREYGAWREAEYIPTDVLLSDGTPCSVDDDGCVWVYEDGKFTLTYGLSALQIGEARRLARQVRP